MVCILRQFDFLFGCGVNSVNVWVVPDVYGQNFSGQRSESGIDRAQPCLSPLSILINFVSHPLTLTVLEVWL